MSSIGQLEMRLTEPVEIFKKYNEFMNNKEIITKYNDTLFELLQCKNIEIDDFPTEFQVFINSCNKELVLLPNISAHEAFEKMKSLQLQFQKKIIDDFVSKIPLLEALSDPSVKEGQWIEIIDLTGCKFNEYEKIRFGEIFDSCIFDYKDGIFDICNLAKKKAEIISMLNEIEHVWQTTEFSFSSFKDMNNVLLKSSEAKEILEKIDDILITFSSLESSKFIGQFQKEIEFWTIKLKTTHSVISEWLKVQPLWIKLIEIFGCNANFEEEEKEFNKYSSQYLKMIKIANDTKNVVSFCYKLEGSQQFFTHIYKQFNQCQDSISVYLEVMRTSFPRFYFVSDDDLFEILSVSSNPQAIQKYFPYIFESIAHLDFDMICFNKVIGFSSREGEIVKFSKPFFVKGHFEDWLNDLVHFIKETLRDILSEIASKIMIFNTEQMINEQVPIQISLLSMMIWWTYRVEDSLQKASKNNKKIMNETLQEFEIKFKELVQFSRSIDQSNKIKSFRAESFATSFLHNLDVYRHLIQSEVTSQNHVDWTKQIRYYWKPDDRECKVSIDNFEREYSYEYHGCARHLIVTPITDNCYLSFADSLGSFSGCSLVGPAGSGCVETIKDFAKAFGVFCIIFNCYDQMNYNDLNLFFKGIAQAGVWGDFDEFNRIKTDVLSVVSQHVYSILNACRENAKQFRFTDGSMLKLDNRAGIFISINSSYKEGQEIPENLKNQFRKIDMNAPDKRSLIRVILAICGFSFYDELSYKFALFYQLCSEKLSKRTFYNWGIRNISSTYHYLKKYYDINQIQNEKQILKTTIENMNICKLVDEDIEPFLNLLNDTFNEV